MGKPWPHDTPAKLTAAGYKFLESLPCRGRTCTATVHLYQTPKGKRMPFSNTEDGRLEPHFGSCCDVARFRKKPAAQG